MEIMEATDPPPAPADRLAEAIEAIERLVVRLDREKALLLNARDAAALCGISSRTFRRAVARGVFPPQVAVTDGLALWSRKAIEAAVAKLKSQPRTKRITRQSRTLSNREAGAKPAA